MLVSGVKQACSEFLEKQLDPSNCLGIRIFAENHSCGSLKEAAEAYIFKYFEEIIDQDEFLTLNVGDVNQLIQSDEIQVLLVLISRILLGHIVWRLQNN